MKRSSKKLFLVVLAITMSFTFYAQVLPPGPGPPPPVGLPIDGGLALLLGSGIVYAISKLRKR